MSRNWILITALSILSLGCSEKATDQNPDASAEQDCSADSDADGVDDCTEAEIGTDPEAADSDGDGLTDAEEMDCGSDPLDAEELWDACGWEDNDPGNVESTGNSYGDIMNNFALVDQCGEMVDMWDFHGEYHVLYMTAAW